MPRVRCRACGHVFEPADPDEWIKTCPACDYRFYVPSDEPEPEAPAGEPEAPAGHEVRRGPPQPEARPAAEEPPARPERGRRGCACALVAAAGLLALAAALALLGARALRDADEEQRLVRAFERLGRASRAHAAGHGGRLPDSLAPLPAEISRDRALGGVTIRPGLAAGAPPDLVHAWSRPTRAGMCAVLFADGRVQVMPEAELGLLLEAQQASPDAWARP